MRQAIVKVFSYHFKYLFKFSHGEVVETMIEDPKLDVDIGSVVREGGAGGHLDEVEADDHRVVQPRPRL